MHKKQNLKQKSHYHTNMGKAYAFLFGQCTTGLQHRIEAKAKYESKIKGNPKKLLETIKENSLLFNDKKKTNIVIIDAITNLMTTRQRDNEDSSISRWQEISARRSVEGYLRSQCLPKKSPHGALIQKPATRQHMPVSCPSCISGIQIKQSMVHSSRRWQKTLPQVGRMSTQSTSRMHNIFCPSTSMTKLIMISGRSNETIVTNLTCPQRMMIIQPLGMYPI